MKRELYITPPYGSYPVLGACRLLGLILWTLLLIGPCALAGMINSRLMRTLARLWHRGVCWIAGLRLHITGRAHQDGPDIYVCNHTSYTDIPVLGSVLKAGFVAKQEVADWPGFRTIAKIGQTVFVARDRMRSKSEANEMTSVLSNGQKLILFPEGTSNDGNRVLPFKSAFFAPAQLVVKGKPVTVQPITITYTKVTGISLNRCTRPSVAWYGDMDLVPHLWSFLQLGRVSVTVDMLPPVTLSVFSDRKELSRHCHAVIRDTHAHRRTAGLAYQPTPVVSPQASDAVALNV